MLLAATVAFMALAIASVKAWLVAMNFRHFRKPPAHLADRCGDSFLARGPDRWAADGLRDPHSVNPGTKMDDVKAAQRT